MKDTLAYLVLMVLFGVFIYSHLPENSIRANPIQDCEKEADSLEWQLLQTPDTVFIFHP
jgi:hypothetical protein